MKRILLYSPDVVGHPRVYCRVIADALIDPSRGSGEVVVALGFTDEVTLADSKDLHSLVDRARVHLIDTRSFSASARPHLTAEELVELQKRFEIHTTLFIEAEKFKEQFIRIAEGTAPRLRGRNLGIFADTAEWYPGENSFTGEPHRLRAPTLRTTLGNIKRALFNRSQHPRYFYETTLIGKRLLDEVLVKDERLSDWRGQPVYWMPEISRPEPAAETSEDAAEFAMRKDELGAFLRSNVGKEPVLYFGDAAYYKGYDLFLEFIAANPGTCGLHPGRTYSPAERSWFRCDVEGLRARLLSEGRLYQTNAYVHTQSMKELFFGAIRVYLTTHRLVRSSSTMIQALELGKPLLVPDRGLLGHRVKTHGLGAVYRYEDMADLKAQAERLWRSDLKAYEGAAKVYWQRFSDTAVRSFFLEKLLVQ